MVSTARSKTVRTIDQLNAFFESSLLRDTVRAVTCFATSLGLLLFGYWMLRHDRELFVASKGYGKANKLQEKIQVWTCKEKACINIRGEPDGSPLTFEVNSVLFSFLPEKRNHGFKEINKRNLSLNSCGRFNYFWSNYFS